MAASLPRPRFALVAASALVVAGVLLAASRGPAPAPGAPPADLVFAQVPAGALPSPGDFRDPHPAGSRVCVLDLDAAGEPRILSEGFHAAGSPAVSPDGRRVLFCGKREPADDWSVYEADLRSGKLRRVTPAGFDALHPDWLAGGTVVFTANAHHATDPRDGGSAFSLYTCASDGSGLERITFRPGSDIDPTVLRDGRVLHAARQVPGHGRPGEAWALFTVNKDGTGILPFHGSHEAPAWKREPRELPDGRVVYSAATSEDGAITLRTVTLRRPMHSLEDLDVAGFRALASASPWGDDEVVVSGATGAGGTAGIWVIGGEDPSPRLLFDDPAMDETDARAVRARPAPRGLVSDTNPESETGTLLCLDARRTDLSGRPGLRLPGASVRIFRAGIAEDGPDGLPAPPAEELVQEIRLASDGSFLAEVPADVPLRFETVDEAGNVLLDSKGWVWVRPGEKRACIGCHEDREATPSNRLPEALYRTAEPAVPPQLALGVTR